MRRRLLAVCRGHAATAGLFRRKANPPSSTSSSCAHSAAPRFRCANASLVCTAMDAGLPFFIKTSSARFLAPPDPNRTRCAGLRFGELAVSFCMQREVRRRGAEMVRAVEGPEIVWRSKTRNTGRPVIIKYRTIVCHDAIIARLNEKVKNKRSTFKRAFLENTPKKEKAPQSNAIKLSALSLRASPQTGAAIRFL